MSQRRQESDVRLESDGGENDRFNQTIITLDPTTSVRPIFPPKSGDRHLAWPFLKMLRTCECFLANSCDFS
jgi:hypothetical protein